MHIRRLEPAEEAFTIMNNAHPLNAVIALRVTSDILTTTNLKIAVDQLQRQYPFLNLGVSNSGGKRYFVNRGADAKISVKSHIREHDETFSECVTAALNTKIDERGPLLNITHVSASNQPQSEIILAFHHSFVDGIVIRHILDALLKYIAEPFKSAHDVQISLSSNLPGNSKYVLKRPPLVDKIRFGIRQFMDELKYMKHGSTHPIPGSSRNSIISLKFNLSESREIIAGCKQKGLALNSLLNASILLAVIRHVYADKRDTLYRTIVFANLRPYFRMSRSMLPFGSYISMLRYQLRISENDNLQIIARRLQELITKSGRKKELSLYYSMTRMVAQMTLALNSKRMATTALSFIGKLDLAEAYGDLRLNDVQAFITNNKLGPEFSGFSRILFGQIGIDFVYMPSEIVEIKAQSIVGEIRELILDNCRH